MAEGRLARPELHYPFAEIPAPASAIAVAPGVLWTAMPLPMALSRINLWLLEDGDGWTVVDTGLRTEDITGAWESLCDGVLAGAPVGRVLVTHLHPDHVGMAGWLTRKFGCPLWMTRTEYLTGRLMAADTGRDAPEEGIRFYRMAGWDDSQIALYRTRFGGFGRNIHPMPESYRRIIDGEVIRIGTRDWIVVVGRGHSPEHACLYCPEARLLISGDQVLPRISSNVSVHPTEPDADPMADWLASLDHLRAVIPDDVLVLPSHNEPFRGLHRRLDHLAADQHAALDRLLALLASPRRAVDVFDVLFTRKVGRDSSLLGFATGESVACLNHLCRRGLAVRTIDAEGVAWYQRTPGADGYGPVPENRRLA